MKQMTLIEMDGFLKGKCIPRDLKVNETNAEYLVRKFAEAEAKCAALAAENAALNDKMDKLATWPGIEFYSSAWEFNNGDGNAALEFMCDVQTPTTDAFLAEVRAQGVEMAACALDDVNQFNYANMLDDLAQKLRQDANTAELVSADISTKVGGW
ncbi:hypothetical protein M0N97_03330 [Escherichia coli]|uniref:hypothetical protein n=1 Tax=Escherichia coli TaxID=562 RepID=UPI0028E0F9E3|nr:hypothetical protein [Escherichia coli]MDT9477126.1 hypothetical protein [Escherichia coli]HCS6193393.1 hypothetical protein [Escherichia coli]